MPAFAKAWSWSWREAARSGARASRSSSAAGRASLTSSLHRSSHLRQGSSEAAPRAWPHHSSPGTPDRASQSRDLAFPIDKVLADGGDLLRAEAIALLDQERSDQIRGDIRVVEHAQVVLQRYHRLDDVARLVSERLAHELDRIAQPLRGNPKLMERLDVRVTQDR